VVDIFSGETAKKESTARYPDAPPWPTEEYSAATKNMSRQMRISVGKAKSMTSSPLLNSKQNWSVYTNGFFPSLDEGGVSADETVISLRGGRGGRGNCDPSVPRFMLSRTPPLEKKGEEKSHFFG
jgi:hypothetical protein